MCFSSAPTAPAAPPPPSYLHNPYLDGASMNGGLNAGRDSLVTMPVSNGLNVSGGSGLPVGPINHQPATPTGPVVPMAMGRAGSVIPTAGGVMAGVMAPPK